MQAEKVKEQAEDISYPKGSAVVLRETTRQSYPENFDNPMIHTKAMKSDNLNESWSFRTRISRSDPQIYPGTFLFL